MRYLAAMVLPFIIVGCQKEESPSTFYERYNQKVVSGISTLEDDARFYSSRKRKEVESRIPAFMKKTNKTREEAIRFYLDFSQAVAKCKKIELVEEVIDGEVAHLTYNQEDVCGNTSPIQETQKVRLVNENGWKIDEVEISL
ncbi:MAG TPA: hypothetical protein VFF91_12845 [Pseudoxanthomonas sp.]|nr:hypothetical protein [Pseudoxanthomonas sp.]